MGSLSCVSTTKAYLYEIILVYSSLPSVSIQLGSNTIQRVAEALLQLLDTHMYFCMYVNLNLCKHEDIFTAAERLNPKIRNDC